MTDAMSLFAELEELHAFARKLPDCDGAAKLHALLARLTQVLQSGGNVAPAASALAAAATASLTADPWVQFENAARAFCEHSGARDCTTSPEHTQNPAVHP